eukprot:TRINITY_DN3798_c0_g1_i2.p2 TRINITY_DN3798_c0_g1~~TRINITY_DN3798_c0_g1_i2.p2  ORF type:complete len:148 (+),score=44.40 TRINITY_DN3798_c0_g1_i2:506-949(+)
MNVLDPSVSQAPWSAEEDRRLMELAEEHDCKWSRIAGLLPGRTDQAVWRRWRAKAPRHVVSAYLAKSRRSNVNADGSKRRWSQVSSVHDQPTELGRFDTPASAAALRRQRRSSSAVTGQRRVDKMTRLRNILSGRGNVDATTDAFED